MFDFENSGNFHIIFNESLVKNNMKLVPFVQWRTIGTLFPYTA